MRPLVHHISAKEDNRSCDFSIWESLMKSPKCLFVALSTSIILFASLCLSLTITASPAAAQSGSTPSDSSARPQVKPKPNELNVSPAAAVSIAFDTAIDVDTVTTRTIVVHGMQSGWLTPTFIANENTITVELSQNFKSGEVIAVSVTTGTLSLEGQRIVSPTVWQFRSATVLSSGYYSDTGQRLGDEDSRDVALGDLDLDGDIDAYVANCGLSAKNPNDKVLFNDGTGIFTDSVQAIGDTCGFSVALGDLDNDGDLDAVVGTSAQNENLILQNDGAVFFTVTQSLDTSASTDIALGDVDGDGDLDVTMVHDTNTWSVWINAGDGTFAEHRQFQTSSSNVNLDLGDLDGDLDLDLFIIGRERDSIWFNDGAGIFSAGSQLFEDRESFDVALGDFDGDGDLDAIIGVFPSTVRSNTILWNSGNGFFTQSEQAISTGWVGGISVGDLNGDGSLDLFGSKYVNLELTQSEIWLNDRQGSFIDSGQALEGIYVTANALGDVDEDGDLDAFIVETTDGFFTPPRPTPNKVWRNHSAPTALEQVPQPSPPTSTKQIFLPLILH
jgi:hypothetical protein